MKRLPKTSEDIFIYLAYPLFTNEEIRVITKHKTSKYIATKANSYGLYKRKKNKRGNQSSNFKGYGELSGSFFGRMKINAKKNNHIFDLNIKYLWELFLKQDKKCYYTGLDLYMGDAKFRPGIASVDRIDSTKDYITNNVVWCHKDINQMKWDFSYHHFITLCQEIYNYQENPITLYNKNFSDFKPSIKIKHQWKGCGQISGCFFAIYKQKAKIRKIHFDITIEEMWELFIKQNGQCVYSGRDLIIPNKNNHGTKFNIPGNASLDRIDSCAGYVINNVQWVDKNINKIKHRLSHDQFLHYIKLIVEHTRNKQ